MPPQKAPGRAGGKDALSVPCRRLSAGDHHDPVNAAGLVGHLCAAHGDFAIAAKFLHIVSNRYDSGFLQRPFGSRLAVIHRGFSSYDKHLYRNLPQWHIPIELRRRLPNLPIFCDPSHIGGKRELVAPLCQQAMDLGFDGLIVESHCDPDCAWSDKNQQVPPDALHYILNMLVIRETTQTTENLSELRSQIDQLDNQLLELLAKRMRVSREIGQYKKEHSMPVLQTSRYDEILQKRMTEAVELGMSADFMKEIMQAIHEESVHQQMEIINK